MFNIRSTSYYKLICNTCMLASSAWGHDRRTQWRRREWRHPLDIKECLVVDPACRSSPASPSNIKVEGDVSDDPSTGAWSQKLIITTAQPPSPKEAKVIDDPLPAPRENKTLFGSEQMDDKKTPNKGTQKTTNLGKTPNEWLTFI